MPVLIHLGIDVGGTASRWVACDAHGVEVGRGRAGGATGHIFNPVERLRLHDAMVDIAAALQRAGLLATSVTAGLTGFGDSVSVEVKALLASTFSLGPDAIVVVDDIMLAYLANFAPGEGHLVSAGTGSIGVHLGREGDGFVRVGGRGILIDDAGSGSWIALRALDRVYRAIDHHGTPVGCETLAESLYASVGGDDWHAVRAYVYGGDRGRIGLLAMAVAEAAHAGDAQAQSILAEAGAQLASLSQALISRVGHRPIGVIGGVFNLHPIILDTLRATLPDQTVNLLQADVAIAAARLQATRDARWTQWLAAHTRA